MKFLKCFSFILCALLSTGINYAMEESTTEQIQKRSQDASEVAVAT